MTPDAKTPPEPRPAISRMQPYEWEPPSAAIARQAGVPEDQAVRFDTNTFPWPGAAVDRQAFLDRAGRARLTWLSNPNNPTGELLPFDYVEALAGATAGILVLDEAYYEMSGVSRLPLIDRMPNVVVVRTLSKAFGLAGARVGYALAGPAISQALRRVRPPGSISVVSAALAVQSLSDLKGMRERVERIRRERTRLQQELAALGF